MSESQPVLKLAMQVHDALSQAIAPATPDTIRVSAVRRNPALITIAVFGLVGFLLLMWATMPGSNGAGAMHVRLSGALLGSAFYAFWTARNYLRDGTFNRHYSQVYLIRFGLGVVAGFILGSVVGDSPQLSGAAQKFGPFTLSVVGGFSAEAVVQILQRIADILVATVRGSDAQRAKADAERITAKKMTDTATRLQDVLQSTPSAQRDKAIQKIMRDMLKG